MTPANFNANEFTLAPMLLSQSQLTLFNNIIANIRDNEVMYNSVSAGITPKLNEVIDAFNNLEVGTPADFSNIQANIDTIMFIESEAGNDSFIGAFTKLFDAINNRDEVNVFKLPITASAKGIVSVDLTQYGFTTTSEFTVLVAVETTQSGRNVSATFKKISPTQGQILLRDGDRITDLNNPESFYDAVDKGLVNVIVTIVSTAKPIGATLTDVNGNTTNLGEI